MNILGTIFGFLWNEVLFRPIFNLLAIFYQTIAFKDFGIALIFATVVIKLLTFSISSSQIKNQEINQKIQNEVKELRARFAHNKEILARKIAELYKENKIKPFGSCLTILVQIFVFSALWRVINDSLGKEFKTDLLYGFVKNTWDWPKELNQYFLGKFDLRNPASSSALGIFLVVAAALTQYLQISKFSPQIKPPGKDSTDQERMTYEMSKQSKFMLPLFSFMFIGLPLGINLYSTFSGFFTILQTLFTRKFYNKKEVSNLESERVVEVEVEDPEKSKKWQEQKKRLETKNKKKKPKK